MSRHLTGRRGLAAAVLLCLAGAFVVLVAVGRVWTELDVAAGPVAPAEVVTRTGSELASGVRALGLVGLAGVVALAATRSWGRVLTGVLLLLAGAGVVATVLLTDLTGDALDGGRVATEARTTGWPVVAALGGVLLASAGLDTVRHGRSWPGLGQRYEAPGARKQEPEQTPAQAERALWEALDRGEDPTAR